MMLRAVRERRRNFAHFVEGEAFGPRDAELQFGWCTSFRRSGKDGQEIWGPTVYRFTRQNTNTNRFYRPDLGCLANNSTCGTPK